MKIDLDIFVDCLKKIESGYKDNLGAKLKRGPEFDDGFLRAIEYIKLYVVPAIEEEESAIRADILYTMQLELEQLKKDLTELERQLGEDENDEDNEGKDI